MPERRPTAVRMIACGLVAVFVLSSCSTVESAGPQGPTAPASRLGHAEATDETQQTDASPHAPSLDLRFDEGTADGAEATGGHGAGETVVATALADEVVARATPERSGDVVARLPNPVATGGPAVFQVLGPIDGPWLEVLLPIRPNGSVGWIEASEVDLSRNPYRIEISTEQHRLLVYHHEAIVIDTEVAIGTGATPTPIGSFYLTELLRPPDPTGPYGTYAFGLSGFSETLQSFNGGEGVIGIHGTDDPDSLGADVSHGCIRVDNDTIDEMAAVLPLGTPVVIGRR